MRPWKGLFRRQPNSTPDGSAKRSPDLPFVQDASGFVQGERQWVSDHFVWAPQKFAEFVGMPVDGCRLLDVGCGDGLLSYGLLTLPLAEVVGLDVISAEYKFIDDLPRRISAAGFTPPADTGRFRHVDYDGTAFPFPDDSFDIVFCWGAFEHIAEPRAVLAEMKRVMRPNGYGFVSVFPWYHCRSGSHLSDFIDVPFFHLTWTFDQVREALEVRGYTDEAQRAFVLNHLLSEFQHLNGYSADRFFDDVRSVGLRAVKVDLNHVIDDLSSAPTNYRLSELMLTGCTMMLAP